MEGVTLQDLAQAVGGSLVGGPGLEGVPIRSVAVDSRKVTPGALFVALPGEKTDGHLYIAPALEMGAVAALVDKTKVALWEDAWQVAGRPPAAAILVDDTLAALGELGRWYKRRIDPVTVAVTGSNGKTTTKEMVASILEQVGPTHRSSGNYNTEIGLPLTLLELASHHRFLVVEMGMRGAGQIRRLARLAEPRVGIVTNVGPVHMEILGSIEAIALAKQELVEELPAGGVAVLNGDDPRVASMAQAARGAAVFFFGLSRGCDVRAEDIDFKDGRHCKYRLVWSRGSDAESVVVTLPLPGRAAVWNSLAAAAAALALGVPLEVVARGLARVVPPRQRLNIVDVANGLTFIEDVYNASPASMRIALETLAQVAREGRRPVAVLGEMKELGPISEAAHRELGQEVAARGVQLLVTVGELARLIGEEARAVRPALEWIHCHDGQEAAQAVPRLVRPGDVVLVKGSRALQLETVVAALYGRWDGEAEGER
ncbi:MAG: UDP-N-acetylmuramoyl-tripeptide--D-alanyl-D-alanine ligase [Limnochordales bacterium]|nr:UDP-N-acetylmuramoyl-tripeptide--D-alanyl-D-alanine ligase [Limnochordales bacterium]